MHKPRAILNTKKWSQHQHQKFVAGITSNGEILSSKIQRQNHKLKKNGSRHSDLQTSDDTASTSADDTAILATHEDPAIASMKLQATNNNSVDWAKK
jgi:hypothetical protein